MVPLENDAVAFDRILAAKRKLSPHFPTLREAAQRRQERRDALAARLCIFAGVALLITFGITHDLLALAGAGVAFTSFVGVCFISGARHTPENYEPVRRRGGQG